MTGLAAGVLTSVLAACGGGASTGSGTGSHTTPKAGGQPGVTKVDVTLVDFRITLSKSTFTAGRYDFVAKNNGHQVHALEIEGPGGEHRTRTLAPGGSASLAVTLKPGTYEVYCPVDGHKDLGMETKITTVGGGASPSNSTNSGGGY
ncbi:cupredoxin domain-containing protein [Streptomyces lutosisoli]|uniref:Cupredoxin domain-containing protein n=1 Tax=Streptomyces lutosisoli TaxID=2665721 RepID=A0ABW2VY04_9ACTN